MRELCLGLEMVGSRAPILGGPGNWGRAGWVHVAPSRSASPLPVHRFDLNVPVLEDDPEEDAQEVRRSVVEEIPSKKKFVGDEQHEGQGTEGDDIQDVNGTPG
ncbi:hypothetical protein SEVIR_3G339140v4 [Setaria viridis]